jgi:feruloyl esterase
MDHCGFGGGGLIADDWLPAITDWVENGKPPASVPATQRENKQTVRTRPLCPWPAKAVWSGNGSRDEAGNWSCSG